MQLSVILAVLAALTISQNSGDGPVSAAGFRLALAGCGMAAVALFAQMTSGAIARGLIGGTEARPVLLDRFRLARRVHTALWMLVAMVILYGLDWARLVRFNWGLDGTFLLDDLLILVPVVLPLVLSWAAFYEVDRALGDGEEVGRGGRLGYVAVHARHYLGILLVPVLVLLAVHDGAELIAPGWLDGPDGAPWQLVPLALLFLLLPLLMRFLWKAQPLPAGPLRERLEAVSRRTGFRARDILVWDTGSMVVNAAVVGFVPGLRYVLLSDALVQRLGEEEIEAVFGHEVGHIRHRHLLLRAAVMFVPLCLWLAVSMGLPETADALTQWVDALGPGWKTPMALAALAAMGVYALAVFGLYSRLLEHQADLYACEAIGPSAGERRAADVVGTALERLAAAAGMDPRRASWQHASVARRVEFLRQMEEDPVLQRRFHRRVRLLGVLVVLAVASPLAALLLAG